MDIASGFGYEWDVNLINGPYDGMNDRVISLESPLPPEFIEKKLTDKSTNRPTLGQKVFEAWGKNHQDQRTPIALYQLRGLPEEVEEEDTLTYDFVKFTTIGEK